MREGSDLTSTFLSVHYTPMPVRRRNKPAWEGWFFAYQLTPDSIRLWWLRCIPLGRILLSNVSFLRQRSQTELTQLVRDTLTRPARSWYWPHPLRMGRPGFDHAPYVLGTASGSRIYLKLRHGFHYRLREAIGRAREKARAHP
ncbi:MAG: hypothetical protein KBA51_05350 [Kiritimatiellae bacterium]|nr:hypothetical protein [Kiritimatiellia bacterium]